MRTAQEASNLWAKATSAAALNYREHAPLDLDRLWADYKRWFVEGTWTFERFCQALDDTAALWLKEHGDMPSHWEGDA